MRLWLCGLLIVSSPAFAGRPLTTEDASALGDKRCQVEAWVDRARDGTQGWLVPACNFAAGVEWQAGFARAWADGTSHFSEAYVQAKTLLYERGDSPWGMGLVVGVTRLPLNERYRRYDNPYVTLPVTIAIGEGLVHLNGGWSRDRETARNVATWGVAAEVPAHARWTLTAEIFGQDSGRPFVRAGGRVSLVPGSLDLDLTVVTRPGGTRDERFVSLGVFWQGGRFAP